MIDSIILKHHDVEVIKVVVENGQLIKTLADGYDAYLGINNITLIHNISGAIEPVEGRVLANCTITNDSISDIIMDVADGYSAVATNSDGSSVKAYEKHDNNLSETEADVGLHYKKIKERWTRENHP
jgi:hypothetical protein